MLQDACHDLVGQLQSAPSRGAIHHGRAARAHAIPGSAQFGSQRLFLLGRQRCEIEFRLRAGLDARGRAARPARVKSTEIYSCCWKKRSLRTRSVETRLAVTLATAPGSEIQARVRDVHFVGDDGNARCALMSVTGASTIASRISRS